MQLRQDDDHLVLEISPLDLSVLQNGLNEALEALDEWEFPIRVGVDVEDARRLLADLRAGRARLDRGAG